MSAFPAVVPPDPDAERAARSRQQTLTKPPGSLGRLEDLSVWVAACQGACPPHQFTRARVVVFAGDHGVTGDGTVSAYPREVTAAMVREFLRGGAAVNVLARTRAPCIRASTLTAAPPRRNSRTIAAVTSRG